MNIGIDIDGVLTNLERVMLDFGTKMCVDEGWPVEINISEYSEKKAFNWNERQVEKFWNKYWIKYIIETKSREFSSEIIEKLQQEGNKIFLITARDENGIPPEYYGKTQQLTEEWLKEKNIKYEKLIFASDNEKLSQCIENKIDIMIEDSPKNIKNISNKIKVIKFDCQYNKHVNGENIITAYSWYHIYKIINELRGV